ncbi:MAG: nucleotidyltransferase domain-containing protein [Muribaculaceae bacterium]|nr:nucleotidyltransferase domain-containing protein [Roseburia sp.]MCM1430681.1 nucleotidyltransferase domain-containing protein [Muribaculaceae bacterium]MCM1491948.1 nucleotidyltransferase domain-containing protein [Muribaculaceae bacterium]
MEKIKDDNIKKMLIELAESLRHIYGDKLKEVVLYGSVARGTQTDDSDIDIMVLIDGDNEELHWYDDRLNEVSTDFSLRYLKVFSIVDVSYQEYEQWRELSPFYRNVSKEGVILYAA